MVMKCIAIGNRIMGDDSIGIKVAEEISPLLKKECIELMFGETDIDYALSKIEEGDFLFIIDSSYLDLKPGTVTFTAVNTFNEQSSQVYSQHQPNLINILRTYGIKVDGFIIGIEIEKIEFSLELSDTLKNKLPQICDEVFKFIYNTTRRIYYA